MGWATVVSCDVACHVMSLDVLVMSVDAMWLLVSCHVTWCNAMSCDVRSCEELSSVVPCNGMECYEVKPPWFSKQLYTLYYKVLPQYYSNTTLYFKVLLQYYSNTTLYFKVLLQYYKVLPQYYKVLLQYYSVLLQYYSVLQSTTPYYKVLLQYCSVLQSTTPKVLCTTKYYPSTTKYYSSTTLYYSSTTPYYSVLLQYYSNTTLYFKVLLQYYSNTTLYFKVLLQYYKVLPQYYKVLLQYYKVLLQYYSVLQSTTPVLLCTTPVLLCTTKYYSSTTLYYKVLLQYCKVLVRYYFETSFTMRVAERVTLQPHEILRLPRKMDLMIDLHHTWNVIYNARSNRQHPPTSRNTAPATQNEFHDWSTSHMKLIYNARSKRQRPPTSPNTAPATQNGSHDWSASHMKRHLQCAEQRESPSNLTEYCACHAKGMSWLILLSYETSFTMRKARGITLQPHQILRLPRKRNDSIVPAHIWNVIYNAQSNRHQPPTSPNTAPATPKECHDWSASHMKRHLQCAEQQASTSNLTEYCACHAKGVSWLICITYETSFTMRRATGINLQPHQILRLPRKIAVPNLWEMYWKQLKWHFQCATDPRPFRPWSENDPTMIRPWKRKTEPAASPRLLFALARSRFYWKLQRFPLRLSFQISPHAAPATKSDTWTSPHAAPATKSDTWTSPNAAPATKSDTKWHMTTSATATATTTTTTTSTTTTTTRTTTTRTTTTRSTTTRTTTSRTTTSRTTTTTTTTRTTTTTTRTTTCYHYEDYYY